MPNAKQIIVEKNLLNETSDKILTISNRAQLFVSICGNSFSYTIIKNSIRLTKKKKMEIVNERLK